MLYSISLSSLIKETVTLFESFFIALQFILVSGFNFLIF